MFYMNQMLNVQWLDELHLDLIIAHFETSRLCSLGKREREIFAYCTIETIGLYVARISPFSFSPSLGRFNLAKPWRILSHDPNYRDSERNLNLPRDPGIPFDIITPRLYSCLMAFSPAPILAAAANRDRHEPTSTSFIVARRSAEAEG